MSSPVPPAADCCKRYSLLIPGFTCTLPQVGSPLMVGTDIRLMTPIMQELLLNKELIAINQDTTYPPGDQMKSCGDAAWVTSDLRLTSLGASVY